MCMMLAYLVAKGHKPHVMVVRTKEGRGLTRICEVKDLKMGATGSVTIWPLSFQIFS